MVERPSPLCSKDESLLRGDIGASTNALELRGECCSMAETIVTIQSIGSVGDGAAVGEFYRDLPMLPESLLTWQETIYEPPAAGFSEIANVVSFLADSKELLLPAASWVAGRYGGAASDKFRGVLSRCRRSRDSGRPYVPMMIGFGTDPRYPSVRFFFHREVVDDELRRQLFGMVQILERLPEEAFRSAPGSTENGFSWDHQEARWRENYANCPLMGDNDEALWFPKDVFDDWT